MANNEQLEILSKGVEFWNKWRMDNPQISIDLQEAHLYGADLRGVNLAGANLLLADLRKAILTEASLFEAELTGANAKEAHFENANLMFARLASAILFRTNFCKAKLSSAFLMCADLAMACFFEAKLNGANLSGANMYQTSFKKADLAETNLAWAKPVSANFRDANLTGATLVQTNFEDADLTNCRIFGVSAWGLNLKGATQRDLILTPEEEPIITVDNLEVAQFIYLLLHNEKIRDVIDTITSKVVLILGRFTPERKAVLDAIRDELRKRNYLPVMFDFDKPVSRDFTETISTLAHMARFIIADITNASAVPIELERIVPGLPSVPVVILVHRSSKEYALFDHVQRFPWVLKPYRYEYQAELIASIGKRIIDPAEKKVTERKPVNFSGSKLTKDSGSR